MLRLQIMDHVYSAGQLSSAPCKCSMFFASSIVLCSMQHSGISNAMQVYVVAKDHRSCYLLLPDCGS